MYWMLSTLLLGPLSHRTVPKRSCVRCPLPSADRFGALFARLRIWLSCRFVLSSRTLLSYVS